MDHRHMFNTPQIVETDNDQGWNYAEQPYVPIARGASESSSIQDGHFPSQWTPASRSSGYSSSILNGELPHYQVVAPGPSHDPFLHQPAAGNLHVRQDNYSHHPSSSNMVGQTVLGVDGGYSSSILNGELPHYQAVAPGPSHDPFLHQPAAGNLHMRQDNYSHHPSSSNMVGQTVHGVDSGFYDQTIVSGKGPYKRKSPGVALMGDGGSTSSRYCSAGSSSDIHLPVDPWQEKQSAESYHTNWEYPPSYEVNTISVGSEGTLRNTRSRTAVDLHHSSSSRSSDQSNSRDFWGQSLNAPMRDWNRNLVSPTADGVTFGSNSGFLSQDPSYLNTLNNHPIGSLDIGGCNNDVSNRNHIPENVSSNLNQSVRGVRSGYGQRSTSTFRASSSNFCPGYVAASDEGQQMVAKSYPSRHPRPSSNLRLRNVDRIGRNYVSSERYRASTEEGVVMDHSSYYGSRSMVDQHRNMRLDIDNMSYEELLALGERIGSVSTGLSDGLISKSLTESIYCSSDLFQDDGTCVICLEEYKNMDDVGTLRVCGHDFHVCCIRKWLSMKNVCPICKAAAVDDGIKGK